jgi:hypothetical protein
VLHAVCALGLKLGFLVQAACLAVTVWYKYNSNERSLLMVTIFASFTVCVAVFAAHSCAEHALCQIQDRNCVAKQHGHVKSLICAMHLSRTTWSKDKDELNLKQGAWSMAISH